MSQIFYASYLAMWVLVVTEAILLLAVYRHFGLMAMGRFEGVQRDGLGVGTSARSISGSTGRGERVEWTAQLGKTHLLLFASNGCEPCLQVLPALREVDVMNRDVEVLTIVPGPAESAAQLVQKFRPPFLCLAEDGSGAFRDWRVRVTPFAFIIGQDGRVRAKGLCDDAAKVNELFDAAGLSLTVPIPLQSELNNISVR